MGQVFPGAVAAPGVFHFYDIGAEEAEHLGARRPCLNMSEVEDFNV